MGLRTFKYMFDIGLSEKAVWEQRLIESNQENQSPEMCHENKMI